MVSNGSAGESGQSSFLTERDEMSLADEQLAVGPESVADTLEVRDDSLAVLQNDLAGLRGPARVAIIAVGIGLAVVIVGGLLGRVARKGTAAAE